jgi:hypothetical protein
LDGVIRQYPEIVRMLFVEKRRNRQMQLACLC